MSLPGGERLRRRDRLRRRRDFQRVSREGARVSSRSFIFLAAARHPGGAEPVVRLGITASRRVGSAVVRSRIKRRVREWFRRHRAELPAGRDVVVIARAAAAGGSQIEIDRELSEDAGRLRALLEGSAPA